jgi:NADPH2:quinone reductase
VRVVRAEEAGPPDVLHVVEVPDPEPAPGQVVIDVAVAAITFVDTLVRAGRFPPGGGATFPLVPGNGVAGTVAAVGAGVDPTLLGARVVSTTGGSGGYAERVAVPAGEPHRVPEGVDLRTAAALLADGRTAIGLARAAALGPGDGVLVTAAGGGVGSLLVQLARRAGVATIVALAGGEAKRARALDLGADVAVDYRRPGWTEEVRAAAGDGGADAAFDAAFDGVGGDVGAEIVGLLAPGARLVVYGMAGGAMTQVPPEVVDERNLTVVTLAQVLAGPGEARAATAEALAAAGEGRLVPTIGQEYALGRAAEAHAAIEARATVGKSLLLTGVGADLG